MEFYLNSTIPCTELYSLQSLLTISILFDLHDYANTGTPAYEQADGGRRNPDALLRLQRAFCPHTYVCEMSPPRRGTSESQTEADSKVLGFIDFGIP